MNEILAQTNQQMQSAKCQECGSTNIDLEENTFRQSCANCGSLIEDQIMIVTTSTRGNSGGLERQGQITNMRSAVINFDRSAPENVNASNMYKREQKIKTKFQYIISKLGGDHPQFPIAIENALRIWKLCFDKKLTRGYDGEHLAAILFYMACRQMKPPLPFLVLDFAAIVETNVFKLASKFQKLCRDIPIEINSLTDPSIYISRFASMLEFEQETETVTSTACKLVDQMKQDWITTGRRPSGICGAAILIAARMHGFKRSIKEISDVVNLSESTIKKRVNEFLETKCATMTVDKFKTFTRDEVNNNAYNRKEEELELPPIMKQQEKQLIKIQKKEEIKLKKQKEIEEFDQKYNNENDGNNSDKSCDIQNNNINATNGNNNEQQDNNDDDIESLMKPDPTEHTVFIAAKQTDDEIINGVEIKKSSSQRPETVTNGTQLQSQTPLSDKREMDASDDENMNVNVNVNMNNNCNEDIDILDRNDGYNNNNNDSMLFENGFGDPGPMSYITAATRSDLIDDNDFDDNDFNNGGSFIVGANATQLNEYEDLPCDNKQKMYKYYEDNDLTHLDNDPEVKAMILNEDEIVAKNQLFMVCNPDWIKVKKDMDKREMIKEEKERKSKRNLRQSYKDDPYSFVAGKVKKRFRSDKLNLKVFHKLMGNNDNNENNINIEKSPSINIKKQDPLS